MARRKRRKARRAGKPVGTIAKGMRPVVAEAFAQLDDIRERAEAFGIQVQHRIIRSGRMGRETLYVFFEHEHVRLVDYWAGTGTVLLGGIDGERTKADDMEEAFELARHAIRRLLEHIH